jgi:hypothetical protein
MVVVALVVMPPLIRLMDLLWIWLLRPTFGWWWRLWLPGFH